jgi:hypothetical protein
MLAGCQSAATDGPTATAASDLSASPRTPPAPVPNLTPSLEQFALYAEHSVSLGDWDEVHSGDVGVRMTAPAAFGDQLLLGRRVETSRQQLLYAPSVSVGDDARVGLLQTRTVDNHGGVFAGQAAFPATAMPLLPLAPPPTVGTAPVSVRKHSCTKLSPGAYAALTVDGTLFMVPGDYTFTSVALSKNARIVALPNTPQAIAAGEPSRVTIHVASTVVLGEGASIEVGDFDDVRSCECRDEHGRRDDSGHGDDHEEHHPCTHDPSQHPLPYIEVAGSDNQAVPTVSLGDRSSVEALIVAPHGTLSTGDEVSARGAFAAFDIRLGRRVFVERNTGLSPTAASVGSQPLSGYYGNQPDLSFPVMGAVPPTATFSLSIGLPVRDAEGLKSFISGVSNPKSPTYRHYINVNDFKATYGATDADYATLTQWAQAAGLTVQHSFTNNLLLTVSGTASQIENAFHTNLVYRQTNDGQNESLFVAVDREPSVDLSTKLLWVTGFNDYQVPHDSGCTAALPSVGVPTGGGFFNAADLRAAYLGNDPACTGLDGTGEVVGVLALRSLANTTDIPTYITLQTTGINPNPTQVSIINVSTPGSTTSEAAADIELTLAMAPNAKVTVYQTATQVTGHADDALHQMANDPTITVATNSYSFGRSDNSAQAIAEMAARGVTFYTASGDFGDIGDPQNINDIENQTLVGGTNLNMSAAGVYGAETTWNQGCPGIDIGPLGTGTIQLIPGYGNGSQDITSGGIMDGHALDTCSCFPQPTCCGNGVPIPGYQDPALMTPAGGSAQWRNYPDVAGVAFVGQIVYKFNGKPTGFVGTSVAAPVWAGLTALINQRAKTSGIGPVGFANPVLYAIGATRGLPGAQDLYGTSFHDIADGVFNSATPGLQGFAAVAGYDLATGWGTPTCGLVKQLSAFDPTAPQTYNQVLVHLANGEDGVEDQSSVDADLVSAGGTVLATIKIKVQGEGGWSDRGAVHDVQRVLPGAITPSDVASVVLHLHENGQGGLNADNWDVEGFSTHLTGVHVPQACLTNISGNGACPFGQPSCRNGLLRDGHPGVVRLSEKDDGSGQGPDATFFTDPNTNRPGGCGGRWTGPQSAEPFTQLQFVLDTSNDDLRSDSELSFDLLDTNGNSLEHGILHAKGSPKFDNNTEYGIVYTLTNGARSYTDIGAIQMNLDPAEITCAPIVGCSHDEWHAQSVSAYALQPIPLWSEMICLFHGTEPDSSHPEFVFSNDNKNQTLGKGSGCL